jgi:hypothetical protein
MRAIGIALAVGLILTSCFLAFVRRFDTERRPPGPRNAPVVEWYCDIGNLVLHWTETPKLRHQVLAKVAGHCIIRLTTGKRGAVFFDYDPSRMRDRMIARPRMVRAKISGNPVGTRRWL